MSLLAHLANAFLGPPCTYPGCDYRGRGWRTLARHLERRHP